MAVLNLKRSQKWLITGVAGFIGSNLLEAVLKSNQKVVGLDNFMTGHQRNLDEVKANVGESLWRNFTFIKGDIRDFPTCLEASRGVDLILHQAALGSVPRSISDPLLSHACNVDGTVNLFKASVDNKVSRIVYASSSSVYGDAPELPKVEGRIGQQLSPYAVTKYTTELYGQVFHRAYGLETIGLRYFNVFGRRQDPASAYAAVIPKWMSQVLTQKPIEIFGDGETSRDFCYIENVVQANLLAATEAKPQAFGSVCNVAVGDRTTLNQLHEYLCSGLKKRQSNLKIDPPTYRDFRAGDVRHSLADISRAKEWLGYNPTHSLKSGLEESLDWYLNFYHSKTEKAA